MPLYLNDVTALLDRRQASLLIWSRYSWCPNVDGRWPQETKNWCCHVSCHSSHLCRYPL